MFHYHVCHSADFSPVHSLLRKYSEAVQGVATTETPFHRLTESVSKTSITQWEAAEKKAMELRGEYLKIYDIQLSKGTYFGMSFLSTLTEFPSK